MPQQDQLDRMEKMLNAVYVSQEKMRKYMLWTMIVTIAVIVIPLFILPLLLPAFLNSVVLPSGV